jgi:uncharacterized membrane protein
MVEFLVIGLTIVLTSVFALARASRLRRIVLVSLVLWLPGIAIGFRDVPPGERWKALVRSPVGALVFVPMLPLVRLFRVRN